LAFRARVEFRVRVCGWAKFGFRLGAVVEEREGQL